jgi:hypothetical protein
MEATASTATQMSEQVLAQLVEQLKADATIPVIDAWLKPQKATGRSVRFVRRTVRPSICFRFSTETPP